MAKVCMPSTSIKRRSTRLAEQCVQQAFLCNRLLLSFVDWSALVPVDFPYCSRSQEQKATYFILATMTTNRAQVPPCLSYQRSLSSKATCTSILSYPLPPSSSVFPDFPLILHFHSLPHSSLRTACFCATILLDQQDTGPLSLRLSLSHFSILGSPFHVPIPPLLYIFVHLLDPIPPNGLHRLPHDLHYCCSSLLPLSQMLQINWRSAGGMTPESVRRSMYCLERRKGP